MTEKDAVNPNSKNSAENNLPQNTESLPSLSDANNPQGFNLESNPSTPAQPVSVESQGEASNVGEIKVESVTDINTPKTSSESELKSFPNNPKRTEADVEASKPAESNEPATAPAPPAPPKTRPPQTEPPEEPSRGASSPQIFLLLLLGIGVFAVLAFYGALLWALWTGNASNPLFETLGIEAIGLKNLLLMMTNAIFGIVALIFLVTTLVFIFRWGIAKKTDVNKRSLLFRFFAYLMLFLTSCGAWFFFYFIIDQATEARGRAVDNSLIVTDPESVIGLSAPITVNFDIGERLYPQINRSVIRQINWDFDGDGQYDASGDKVSHRFLDRGQNNGRYPVTAEIFYFSSVEGREISFKSQKEVIINNEAVVAKVTAIPESGAFPLEVEFNAAESKDPDGEIVLYEWDLDGDGEFEIRQETPTVLETFTKVGEYKIRLRVTGRNNDTNVAEQIITVQTPESDLKAVISSKDPLEGFAPLKVLLDGSQSFVKEGLITRYEWFVEGEEEPVLGRKLQRVFREAGAYKVTLTVQNDLGERQRTEKTIVVEKADLNAEVVIKTTPELKKNDKILKGVVPFEVTFDSSQSKIKDPLEWRWDFQSDGIEDQYGEVVQHIFRDPGNYEVKLVIVDSDNVEHEKLFPIQVDRSGVVAKIVADPPAGPAPITITFDGSGSSADEGEIVNYIWEFPGQEPLNYGAQIDYLFEKVGNYVVRMTVLTSEGKTSTDEIIVSARAPVVKADFEVVPSAGPAPLEVKATPFIPKGIIREYVWDFGDGSEPYRVFRPDPQRHTYIDPGEYILKMRLVDQNGIISEQSKTITVR